MCLFNDRDMNLCRMGKWPLIRCLAGADHRARAPQNLCHPWQLAGKNDARMLQGWNGAGFRAGFAVCSLRGVGHVQTQQHLLPLARGYRGKLPMQTGIPKLWFLWLWFSSSRLEECCLKAESKGVVLERGGGNGSSRGSGSLWLRAGQTDPVSEQIHHGVSVETQPRGPVSLEAPYVWLSKKSDLPVWMDSFRCTPLFLTVATSRCFGSGKDQPLPVCPPGF